MGMDVYKHMHVIKNSTLFDQMTPESVQKVFECLGAYVTVYSKGECILHEEEKVDGVAFLIRGEVNLVNEDFWGRRTLVARVRPGEVFAEAFACMSEPVRDMRVYAESECEVAWLDVKRMFSVCSNACECHNRLLQNLVMALAEKNMAQSEKMVIMSKHNTREKLLCFLSKEAKRQKRPAFKLDLNQRELAEYLSLERSGVSTQLNRLRSEGVIDFDRNTCVLKKDVVPK